MMHKGEIILDKKDQEKEKINVDNVLDEFNKISIEVGNSV